MEAIHRTIIARFDLREASNESNTREEGAAFEQAVSGFVPKEHLKMARHFNAGFAGPEIESRRDG